MSKRLALYCSAMKGGRPAGRPAGPADAIGPDAPAGRGRLRWGLAVLLALIPLGLAACGGGGDSTEAARKPAPPRIVTPAELAEAEEELEQPIYWAGPVKGAELELNDLGETGVQVLYLPDGTKAGQGSAKTLTIGSYPLSNPEAELEGFAKRQGSVTREAEDGTELVTSEQSPSSVYFVDPDNEVQIEVYEPSAEKAMHLARSGKVKPAG